MFPAKRDRKWLIALPAAWLLLTIFILTISSHLLNFTPGTFDLALSSAVSLVGAVAVCGFGYAGLKLASLCSALGIISGLLYMSHIFIHGNMEFKGLAGLLSGAELAFIFFMVGINGQMIAHMINKRRAIK